MTMIGTEHILAEPETVVGIILNAEGLVAMIKRNCPPMVGKWALPGGERWEWETPLAAMEREVWEETGIVVQKSSLLMKEGSIYYFLGYELHRDERFHPDFEVEQFQYMKLQDPRVTEAYPENQNILDKFLLL